MRRNQCRILVANVIAIAVIVVSLMPASLHAEPVTPDTKQSIAFFGFRLINSSLVDASEAEINRIKLLDTTIKKILIENGRLRVIDVPEDILQEIAKSQFLGNCECEAEYGKRVGAKLMGWGTVQKISNLILNINIYIADVETNQYKFIKSADIRGNTDTSWLRGLRWLMRYYLDELK